MILSAALECIVSRSPWKFSKLSNIFSWISFMFNWPGLVFVVCNEELWLTHPAYPEISKTTSFCYLPPAMPSLLTQAEKLLPVISSHNTLCCTTSSDLRPPASVATSGSTSWLGPTWAPGQGPAGWPAGRRPLALWVRACGSGSLEKVFLSLHKPEALSSWEICPRSSC